MGTWSSDNFGNDGACDYLAEVVDYLLQTLKPPIDFLEIDEVMASAEMLLAICQRCGVAGQLRDLNVDSLKEKVFEVYDTEIDDYHPEPNHKRDRREIINRTFEELKTVLLE